MKLEKVYPVSKIQVQVISEVNEIVNKKKAVVKAKTSIQKLSSSKTACKYDQAMVDDFLGRCDKFATV